MDDPLSTSLEKLRVFPLAERVKTILKGGVQRRVWNGSAPNLLVNVLVRQSDATAQRKRFHKDCSTSISPSVHASYGIAVIRRYKADVSSLHENQRRGLG